MKVVIKLYPYINTTTNRICHLNFLKLHIISEPVLPHLIKNYIGSQGVQIFLFI